MTRQRSLDPLVEHTVKVLVEQMLARYPDKGVLGVTELAKELDISERRIYELLKFDAHKLPPQIAELDSNNRWAVARVALWLITEYQVRYASERRRKRAA